MTRRLLVRGATVLTMDPGLGDLERGDVLVEGECVSGVAPRIEAEDCEVLDGAGAILSPGFVDTHRHVWQTQLRGVAADWTLFDYTVRMRMVYGSAYEADDAYLGNYAGALEAVDAGITTLVDHSHIMNSPEHADAALDGLADAGIRGVFCYGLYPNPEHDPFSLDFEPGWRMEDARRLRRDRLAADDGLLRFGLAPSEVVATPIEQVERELSLARELGALRVSCHVSMGRWDRGARTVERLAEAGCLGEDMLFVHGSTLTDSELAAIAASGANVSCTPETELQMAMGRPVLARARAAGAAPSIGIDIVSNVSGDMFAQMRLLLQSERGFDNEARSDPPRALELSARDVLRLATIDGARAAGLERLTGSITPGKQADLVLTRTDAVHIAGVADPVAALVFYARPSDVDTVLVAGEPRKRDGRLLGVDWPQIRARLCASGAALRGRAASIPSGGIGDLVAAVMFPSPGRGD